MNAPSPKLKTVEQALSELPSGLMLLRAPFKPNQISKLPKPTKQQTEAVSADFKKGIRCKDCGAWHHPEVVHLDYVGHAALTDRLLDVDPAWSWEPAALTDTGLPAFDQSGGLWIRLTVLGVTRLGYGHAKAKPNQDPGAREKEVIGDALRNAAMRFGAALDLWHKGDLHADAEEPPANPSTGERKPRERVTLDGPYTCPTQLMTAAREFVRTLNGIGDLAEFIAWKQTDDVKQFVNQLRRDMPDWWVGGPSVPADFVPIEILVAQKKRDLEQLENVQ